MGTQSGSTPVGPFFLEGVSMSQAKYPTTSMCDGTFLEMFEPTTRDSDVFIATAAKCGQTWLQTLLFHLKTRGHAPDFDGNGLMAVSPWLELPADSKMRDNPRSRDDLLKQFEALEDPRVFKLHVVWEEIPRAPGTDAKVITITRDPREVPYSMYSHLKGMTKNDTPPKDFDSYFEEWMDFGFYYKFVQSFWPHMNDPDVLWLRYEDLQADIKKEALKILDFLGWTLSDEDIERALPLADFSRMKKKGTEKVFGMKDGAWKKGQSFFREGGVGKNRARLSAEQEARILERAKKEFEPACFDWVISLPEEAPA
jgi:hypothetical protein